MLSSTREHELREKAAASSKHAQNAKLSKSQKKAHQSALAVRDIIIGSPSNVAAPKVTPAFAKPQLSKIKSQLLEPKAANQVIAHLKQLPTNDSSGSNAGRHLHGPIHAVCLEHTDAEEHLLHFASLAPEDRTRSISVQEFSLSGVSAAPLDALSKMFKEMQIVDLIRSPDFGLGQPGDGDGILAGALPTAETVIDGIKQITPELMALGFATSKAVLPDHSGIYPPTDRISILTYWWGLEILLPPPTLGYLASAQSITGALMNFLSALSLVNNGVREILPFIRYIAQFIDFEFSSIQKQDEGNGVVCAATWYVIMPAALVPRPWDFPLPPAGAPASPESGVDKTSSQAGNVVPQPQAQPKQISSILDTVTTRVAVTA
ncbi:hypothetical protein CPC08DRAFT_627911 [Agrocybe pediades]|nr:hypothetical protein CPC08DRAFT_627911 [Agrocybe pediades]